MRERASSARRSDFRAGVEEWEEPLHLGSLPASYPTFPHNATLIAHFFPQSCSEAVKSCAKPLPAGLCGPSPRPSALPPNCPIRAIRRAKRVGASCVADTIVRCGSSRGLEGEREKSAESGDRRPRANCTRALGDVRSALGADFPGSRPRALGASPPAWPSRSSRVRSPAAARADRPARTPTPPGSSPLTRPSTSARSCARAGPSRAKPRRAAGR